MLDFCKVFVKAFALLFSMLLFFPLQWVASFFKAPVPYVLPQYWYRLACWILGLEIRIVGTPAAAKSVLYVSNHASYLDIIALGATLRAAFIAKADISGWPIIGFLGRLQHVAYVKRERTQAKQQGNALTERLSEGDALILFAEGTTSDGLRILPLKSSLISTGSAAEIIQPVTISFTGLNGFSVGRSFRQLYAWFGDMTLAPHFTEIMRQRCLQMTLEFGVPLRFADFKDRKAITQTIEDVMRTALEAQISR